MANLQDKLVSQYDSRYKLPNKELLQKFAVLAEGNDDERAEATKAIIDHLTAQQSPSSKARKLVTFSDLIGLALVHLIYSGIHIQGLH